MPSLTVWKYPTPLGVDAGELLLRRLEEQGALTVHDAVAVIWMPGADRPEVRRVRHRTAGAAGKGSFWGALVGTLVLAPRGGRGGRGERGGRGVPAAPRRRAGRDRRRPAARADARDVVGPALARSEGELIHAEMDDETAEELRRLMEG